MIAKLLRFRNKGLRDLVWFQNFKESFRNYGEFSKNCDFEKMSTFRKHKSHQHTFRNYTISKVYQKSKYFSSLYKREKTESTIRKSIWSTFLWFRNLVKLVISKFWQILFFKESNPKTRFYFKILVLLGIKWWDL